MDEKWEKAFPDHPDGSAVYIESCISASGTPFRFKLWPDHLFIACILFSGTKGLFGAVVHAKSGRVVCNEKIQAIPDSPNPDKDLTRKLLSAAAQRLSAMNLTDFERLFTPAQAIRPSWAPSWDMFGRDRAGVWILDPLAGPGAGLDRGGNGGTCIGVVNKQIWDMIQAAIPPDEGEESGEEEQPARPRPKKKLPTGNNNSNKRTIHHD
jgi:hypothetical protein